MPVFRLTDEQYELIRARTINYDDRSSAWSRAASLAQAIAHAPGVEEKFQPGADLNPMIKAILEHRMEA